MILVKDCLDRFCGLFVEMRINYEKSKIMFSSNVDDTLIGDVSSLANIPCTDDIGMYLVFL